MDEGSVHLLYKWPSGAEFGSRVPKEKIYDQVGFPALAREKFVSEVQRIVWTHKLAPATVNLPGTLEVAEIQVFRIDAKGGEVSDSVLSAIDKAVKFPIIFELVGGEGENRKICMAAAHKQIRTGTPALSQHFRTAWQRLAADRSPLPAAIDLGGLYTALLTPLLPVATRAGDDVSEVAARLVSVRKLEREIATLERKLRTEPQLNRKIELRRTLKIKQAELEQQR
ncbi:DUF4391 domain-containing protein [Arthrobacter sp. BL-252-APC-1A]|uniref:DUF4391 domain-containing protein n=1 Tax=Arthrobacter sp. BL-252-APC-1A TaxID=2606622 RepID=UPI002DDA49A2|nr:DUF4391 domain-containing protein [Arthrobacter sp. BL-252-APC-1A]